MAIGDGCYSSLDSKIAVGQETTFGTAANEPTNGYLEFISESIKTERDDRRLDMISSSRAYRQHVKLAKTVAGSIEAYANPDSKPFGMILQNALGGTVTSAVLSAAVSWNHTFYAGDMESNKSSAGASDVKSLTFNVQRGSTNTWQYTGGRVNTLELSAERGELAQFTAEMEFKDATGTGISFQTTTATYPEVVPFTFVDGTFSYGDSIGNLSAETIQTINLTLNNNLKTDIGKIGSEVRDKIPVGRREINLAWTMRFDTTTSYDRWINHTRGAVRLLFQAGTITGSDQVYQMQIDVPNVRTKAQEPDVSGDEVLSINVEAMAIIDNSASGYDIQATMRNTIDDYES